MSTITKDLGVVTAYGYAVSKGYTGTEEEFAELMASYATVAEEAAQSASTASEKAQQAAQAVLDAVSAKDAAVQAKNDAETAKTSAQQFATSAGNSASAASGSAISASQSASSANSSAESASASAQSASQSAEAANTAKTDAQTAKTDAETAQSKAEEAQAKAEEAADDLSAEVEQIETNESDIAELKKATGSVIVNTASGDIASFSDGADDYPVKDLVAHIEPVQDLHGYANPWPAGGGKNLVPFPYRDPSGKTLNGITFTTNDVGKCHITGTSVGSETYFNLFANNVGDGVPSWLKPGASYTVTPTVATGKYFCQLILYGDTAFTITGRETKTLPNDLSVYNRCAFVIGVYAGGTVDDDVFPALYEGTAPTTWEPYANICPITGWTGANVTRTGANVWDEEWELGTFNTTTGANIARTDQIRSKNMIPVLPNTEYYFATPSTSAWLLFYDESENVIEGYTPSGHTVSGNSIMVTNHSFITPSNAKYVRFYLLSNYGATYNNDISINYPSTATSYEPYQGDTYAVTFPTEAGTVYGGTLDVTTGVLTVDKVKQRIDALPNSISYDQTWHRFLSNFLYEPKVYQIRTAPVWCSCYKSITDGRPITEVPDFSCYLDSGDNHIMFQDTRYDNVSSFINGVGNQSFVYELATPTTYQLTPTEVKTLLGANNIFADTGAVDVEYCADTKKYIDNAIATAIAAL